MAQFLAPVINDQQEDANGNPLVGGTIEVYLAGTSTPATTYSDKAGLVPNTTPIVLNTLGVNQQGAVWLTGGIAYKFIIKNSVGVVQRTIDNVSGVNDSAVTADQWVVYLAAPTYVSATSFTVAGDQTQIFQVGRRVRTQNTGGLVYGTITASAFGGTTTVTVRNDSGALDSGLSQVSYGVISVQNSSVTGLLLNIQTFTASGTYTPTPGTTKILVSGIGSGGGGGGVGVISAGQVGVGGGGASGAKGMAYITSGFTPTVAVTVGPAGIGVSANNGSQGGTSSFGAFLILPGGPGGNAGAAAAVSAASGGAPSGASGSALMFASTGATGGSAISSFAAGYALSGAGGSTEFGSGGSANATGGPASGGTSGTGKGSGGAGAAGFASGGSAGGGTGATGVFVVYEYA